MKMLLAVVMAFIISLVAILIIKPIAKKFGLVDIPNKRKLHNGTIPLIGGIGIFIAIAFSISYFYPLKNNVIIFLISTFIIICMGGADDKFDLRVSIRLSVQTMSALILTLGSGLYLENLGDLIGLGVIHLGVFGIVFTVIAIIGAINAFNMVDGIDGLIGILSLVSFSSLAVLYNIAGSNLLIMLILFIGAISGYFIFNIGWPIKKLPKVFMGDAGSMFIGISIVWFLIVGTQSEKPILNPSTALWIIAIPLMDMASTMCRRIMNKKSPFCADRTHLHHTLMSCGYSPKKTLVIISLSSIIFAFFGIMLEVSNVKEEYSITAYIITFILYNVFVSMCKRGVKFNNNEIEKSAHLNIQ